MKSLFLLVIIINLFYNSLANSNEIYVVSKVNNQIITNTDIKKEYRYLVALNPNLKNMDKIIVMKLAKDSIIKEKIKEDELLKYFDLSEENKYINSILENFYKKLGMKNEKEFKNYLSKYNLSFDEIKKKIQIEAAWNDLIYKKYVSKLEINKIKIKNNINELLSKNKEHNVYLISEILFNTESFEEIQKKYKLIEKSILEVGFKNTANLYSIANSGKLGGKIGWINETQLSEIIKKEVSKLKVGEYTKPITIPGGFLIIHLDDKKTQNIYLNFDEEFEKQIAFEKNAQLEQYSTIYFKKINKNSIISEK